MSGTNGYPVQGGCTTFRPWGVRSLSVDVTDVIGYYLPVMIITLKDSEKVHSGRLSFAPALEAHAVSARQVNGCFPGASGRTSRPGVQLQPIPLCVSSINSGICRPLQRCALR